MNKHFLIEIGELHFGFAAYYKILWNLWESWTISMDKKYNGKTTGEYSHGKFDLSWGKFLRRSILQIFYRNYKLINRSKKKKKKLSSAHAHLN